MKFIRDEEEIAGRSALLTVSCHKDEYEAELAKKQSSLDTELLSSSGAKRKASDISESASSTNMPKTVKLSPVIQCRIVIGNAGLRKFSVSANYEKQVLEIQEELDYEE